MPDSEPAVSPCQQRHMIEVFVITHLLTSICTCVRTSGHMIHERVTSTQTSGKYSCCLLNFQHIIENLGKIALNQMLVNNF